ncbi:hypothetical protein B0H16DRAFT_1310897 [Mycena metata]|uniref:Uncharacterized protein n=1 Tax=Mycena metata TaxID=1033252 RepID=A0AAD7JGH1_9AGAR|nr:hypothetical protein B0H16DRAFT_1310897 [Mycena metata]
MSFKPAATTAAAVAKAGGRSSERPRSIIRPNPAVSIAPPAASLANAGGGDLQSSTQLDSSVIQTTDNGQNPPVAGQANAATSKNNFINFCALGLPQVPITNGLQITSGSCNPTPIGNIPSIANMPSSKFQSPTNGDTIAANTPFNITVKVQKIQLGTFTNAAKTYYANPQTLNAQGAIIGHTHIVVEAVDSLATTTLTDSTKFLFFKGIDGGQDAQGNVQATVAAGLPVGTYRVGTILSSSTHQPVIMPVAQHGLVDDVIYMTVTANGKAAAAPPAAAAAVSSLFLPFS